MLRQRRLTVKIKSIGQAYVGVIGRVDYGAEGLRRGAPTDEGRGDTKLSQVDSYLKHK